MSFLTKKIPDRSMKSSSHSHLHFRLFALGVGVNMIRFPTGQDGADSVPVSSDSFRNSRESFGPPPAPSGMPREVASKEGGVQARVV